MKKYALGCAFNLEDILGNFPYKKLKITCKECENITGDNHRSSIVKKIFRYHVKLVIEDIIANNITYWLPLTGQKKCNIHMKLVRGDAFKNLRQAGIWEDIDILKSNFSGYQLSLFMLGNRTPRVKSIYLNKDYRDRISHNTNEGMQYGDGKYDKTLKDYLEQVYEAFPQVQKRDINTILVFSWKSLYLHNSYGGDTIMIDNGFWLYIGNLKKDPMDHFFYYIRKLTVKLRVLYRRKRKEWDGYYYFALSNTQYQHYLDQKKKRGRPRKYFNFGSVYLYEILDQCRINEYYKKYIFRIPYISKLKIKQFVRDLTSDKAELIITREPLKFKDISVEENEYVFL